MGKITTGQVAELIMKDGRGEFGSESAVDLQWLLEQANWEMVTGLRSGMLITVPSADFGYVLDRETGTTSVIRKFPSATLAAEVLGGRTVAEDVTPSEFKLEDIGYLPAVELGSMCIRTEEGRRRAVVKKANLGLVDAMRLRDLQNRQGRLPDHLLGVILVFPGTVVRNNLGTPMVAWLRVGPDQRWELIFERIANEWWNPHMLFPFIKVLK